MNILSTTPTLVVVAMGMTVVAQIQAQQLLASTSVGGADWAAVVPKGVVITVDGEGGVVKLSPSQRHGIKIMMVAPGGDIIIAHGLHVAYAHAALLT